MIVLPIKRRFWFKLSSSGKLYLSLTLSAQFGFLIQSISRKVVSNWCNDRGEKDQSLSTGWYSYLPSRKWNRPYVMQPYRYWKRLEGVTCPVWVIASPLVAVWCGAAFLRNGVQCWADGSINERVQSRILSTPMKYLEAAIISLDLLEFRVSQLSWILLLATKRLLTYFLPGSATLDRRTRDCE